MVKSISWIVVLLVALGFAASTGSAQAEELSAEMAALPFQALGEFHNQPGETEKAFVIRVAATLASFTHQMGFEACGMIATDGQGGYGIRLGSNQSQIGCLAGEAGLPEGMTWTGETLHSHPEGRALALTDQDRAYAKAVKWGMLSPVFWGSPGGFSAADCMGPAGYLVANGRVFYRPNHGCHATRVGSLN